MALLFYSRRDCYLQNSFFFALTEQCFLTTDFEMETIPPSIMKHHILKSTVKDKIFTFVLEF